MIRRRTLLASLATTGTAGCVSSLRGPPGTELGAVLLTNGTEQSLEMAVRILRDGTLVHSATHEVEPLEDQVVGVHELDCAWSSEPGRFAVEARRGDADWEREEFDGTDDSCTSVSVRARRRANPSSLQLDGRTCETLADGYGCEFVDR